MSTLKISVSIADVIFIAEKKGYDISKFMREVFNNCLQQNFTAFKKCRQRNIVYVK